MSFAKLFDVSVPEDTVKHWMGIVGLVCALVGIACASILLVVAERDMSPYAATFDRLAIATAVFAAWPLSQAILFRKKIEPPDLESLKVESPDSAENSALQSSGLSALDIAKSSPFKLNWNSLGLMLLSGLAFSASLTIWAWSLTQTSVANSTLLNNMMPIFTALGAWVIFRETFSLKFLVGMAMAIAGAVLIALEDLQMTQGLVGDAAALGAAGLAAVNILTIEELRKRFDALFIMAWSSGIGSLVLLAVLIWRQDSFFPETRASWAAAVALALVSQVLGQGLLTYCLKRFSASIIATSMLTIPIIAAVMAWFVFDEQLTQLNLLAFGVVLCGIYVAVTSQPSPEIAIEAMAIEKT